VVASSHDFFLFANVPPGVPNPTKMEKSTSRATERINNHQFSSVFLAMYNTLGPTFAALAAAANSPFNVDGDDDAPPPISCLPPPQAVIFHQLSNDSVIAVTLRFRSLHEALCVHAAFVAFMPAGLSFANANASTPHHHSLSRKPVTNTDGASTCFTLLDLIGMPPKGVSLACDAFADKLVGLSPFGGAFTSTLDSATIEIIVSTIDLVERLLVPALGADAVDSSKDSIFVKLGDATVELVVLDSDSKHACVLCGSKCHRIRHCGRRLQAAERKAKEKAQRDLRNAASAERERTSKLAALDEKSSALISEVLKATGVSSEPIISAMRLKMECLTELTDCVAVTSGLVEASGLNRKVAEFYGQSLAAIASQRDSLRGAKVSPVSDISASGPTASAAPSSFAPAASLARPTSASDVAFAPRAMEGVDEAMTSGDFTAVSSADTAANKRPMALNATSIGESPAKRRPPTSELVQAASVSAALVPAPLVLPDRAALLEAYGSGGIFAFFEGATRNCIGLERRPFPRVFNVDLVEDNAPAGHLGNAMYCDLAQFKEEVDARDSSVEQVVTILRSVALVVDFQRVPYTAAGSLRIDGPSNTQSTGVTIHDFNLSAGIFSNEEGSLFDETAFFRIDVELSKSAASSSVVSFKISRANPALAIIAAYFVQAAPRDSLWKAARVVRVAKPPSGALPLSPDPPALAAGGRASLAPVPPYGSTALLLHGAGGGVGQDGK
jgi:hypothetical protein